MGGATVLRKQRFQVRRPRLGLKVRRSGLVRVPSRETASSEQCWLVPFTANSALSFLTGILLRRGSVCLRHGYVRFETLRFCSGLAAVCFSGARGINC